MLQVPGRGAFAPPPARLAVAQRPGLTDERDEAAAAAPAPYAFLRRAWFESAAPDARGARTLVARRGDGSLLAAIPLVPAGPAALGFKSVPGCYWPFRFAPIAADAEAGALQALLRDRAARRALGPVWRMGPLHAADPSARLLLEAARASGWHVLERPMGETWLLDLAAARAAGRLPPAAKAKRLRGYERRLAEMGALRYHFVRGATFDAAALDALQAIEAASWVGTQTDGSGAKFLRPTQRALWERALRDPRLADMLSAAILFVGERPAAFSFDLNLGSHQYGIAGSYDAAFAPLRVGKLLAWRHLEESAGRGIATIDWGAGDTGYKQEFGCVPGSPIIDCLFVRSAPLAALLRRKWCRPPAGRGARAGA
jgi:CelD/BcsL family acetyltransferase involved in cellulose biosynthesis